MYVINDLSIMIACTIVSFTSGMIGAVLAVVFTGDKNDSINELENRIRQLEDEVEALDGVVDHLIGELKKKEEAVAEAIVPEAAAAEAAVPEDAAAGAEAVVPEAVSAPGAEATLPVAAAAQPTAPPVELNKSDTDILREKSEVEHQTEKLEREFNEAQSVINHLFISGATAVAIAGLASWSYYLYQSPLLRGSMVPRYEVY
jgi:chaperonin cofactor prefoldin